MPKVIRGRAGRENRREEALETYTANLLPMLLKQVKVDPNAKILHLGNPGAVPLAEHFAPVLDTGELVVMVYTYDEMEDARAALAGLGNVHVINEIEDIDPDEEPFTMITSIVPYNLGRDYVDELLQQGLRLLASDGICYLAGDKQQGFERTLELLSASGSRITPVTQVGTMRVVTATRPGPTGGLRRATTA